MKSTHMLALLSALFLVACGKTETAPEAKPSAAPKPAEKPPGESVVSAPTDYLKTMVKDKKQADATIEITSLNKAVQSFYSTEGRFPKDLNEMVTEKYMPSIPTPPNGMKFTYDAAKGEVKLAPQ